MLLLFHKTFKGSRNSRGFALIRVVLFRCKKVLTVEMQNLTAIKKLLVRTYDCLLGNNFSIKFSTNDLKSVKQIYEKPS